uniref:Uncharacterized protein n=1 Tax=Anguilla anguilla TaxID=7936 RepID=A0A0E9W7V4_ANGAN
MKSQTRQEKSELVALEKSSTSGVELQENGRNALSNSFLGM